MFKSIYSYGVFIDDKAEKKQITSLDERKNKQKKKKPNETDDMNTSI
jgi:hypothetical protein